MKRALITGKQGFVGRHLADHLIAAGWDVFGFGRRPDGINSRSFQGEITDRHALRIALEEARPDVIFHLAGRIKSDASELFYMVNLLGTVALFESVLAAGIRPVMVVASSSAVYGHRSGKPISERVVLRPLTHYAVSKVAQEAAALRYYQSFCLPVMIVRMFNLLGPGQSADLACSAFARQIALAELNNENGIVTGNLSARRDFLDVRDAARAFELVAKKGKAGQVYNVCSGHAAAIRKCLSEMISMSPNQFTVELGAARFQKNDIPIQVGNSLKLNRATGWRPKISLRESLSDLLNDWRPRVKSELE